MMRVRETVGLTFSADGEIEGTARGSIHGAQIVIRLIRLVTARAVQISTKAYGQCSFGLLSRLIAPLVGEAESPGDQTFWVKSAAMASRL